MISSRSSAPVPVAPDEGKRWGEAQTDSVRPSAAVPTSETRARQRTGRALRATALFAGFGYAAQALSLVAIPLYLRTLGADGYGLIVLAMSFMGYLNFADAGLSWGSMILIGQADGRGDRELIGKIVRNSLVLAAGSSLVVLLAAGGMAGFAAAGHRLPMFAGHPESDALVVLAGLQLAVILQAGVFYNLFQGLQETHWTAFYQGLGRLAATVAMMAAALWLQSAKAVMLAQLAATAAFSGAAALHAVRRHGWIFSGRGWIDVGQLRLQLRTGAKVFLLQIGRTLVATAPVMALSSALGPAAVPLYTVPTTILQLAFMPLNSWSTSLQSAYGEAWTSGNRAWVADVFRQTLERGFFWGAAGVACFLPLAAPFVAWWTAGRLQLPAFLPLAVAAIAFATWFVQAGQYLLSGLNQQRVVALAEVACGAAALPASVFAVYWLGPAGVGLGLLLPALATSIRLVTKEIRARVGPRAFPERALAGRIGVVFAVAAGAGILFHHAVSFGDGWGRFGDLAATALISCTCFGVGSVVARLEFPQEAWRHLAAVVAKRAT